MLFPVKKKILCGIFFMEIIDANNETRSLDDLIESANGLSDALKEQFKTTREQAREISRHANIIRVLLEHKGEEHGN